ncbi:MAG: hypothetical protein ABIQ10_09060 [Gemmatimonadaceae bacterium]
MHRWLLALSFVVLSVPGQAQGGSATATTGTIDPGMTRAQVIAALGKPATIRNFQGSTYLMYSNSCGKKCGMQDIVILDHDVVVDAMFRSPNRHYTGTSSSPDATKPNSRTQRNAPLVVPANGAAPAAGTATLPTLQSTTRTTVVHTSTTTRPADSAKTPTSYPPRDSAKTPTSYPPHDSASTPTSRAPADSARSSMSLPSTQSPSPRQIEPPLKDPRQLPPAPPSMTAPPTYGTPATTPPPADSAASSMSHPPVDNSSSSTSHPPKPPK